MKVQIVTNNIGSEEIRIKFSNNSYINSSSTESFLLYKILKELEETNAALKAINDNLVFPSVTIARGINS